MSGSIFTRCGCRGADGKQLGPSCPQLTNRRHGTRCIAVRLDTTTGRVSYRRTIGPATDTSKTQASAVLEHIADLIKLAPDATTRAKVGDLIVAAGSGPLPTTDDLRRRLGLSGDLTGSLTTRELFEQWTAAKTRRWRESTRKAYAEKVAQHVVPVIGDIPVERLNAAHVSLVFDRIAERNAAIVAGTAKGKQVGITSQHHIHGVIRAALRWAVKQRLIMFDPSAGVELEQKQRREVVVYTAEQTTVFLTHAEHDPLAVAFRLVLLRGLRRGEVVGLRWSCVDTDNRRLRISDTVLQLGGKIVAGKPKTQAGERWVALDSGTVDALRAHRRRQSEQRLAWGAAYTDSDLVFAREDGSPTRPDHLSARFRALAAEAGLPVIRLHDGRHSAASLGLAAGVDLKVISDQLGHSTIAITANLYQHVVPAVANDAADRVAALIKLPQRAEETGS